MLKRKVSGLLLLGLLLMLGVNEGLFANNYFLYDLNENKILFMGEEETVFTEKLSMDKKPDYIMPTADPERYLAIFTPDRKQENIGRLVIFNIISGRTEDLVDLGYYPYRWHHSADNRQFYISYCVEKNGEYFELLKYDTKELTTLKMVSKVKEPVAMKLSENCQSLYVVENSSDQTISRLLTITPDTLDIQRTLPLGKYPDKLFVLSEERIAIINRDLRATSELKDTERREKGSLKLIDTVNNCVVEERELKEKDVYTTWDDDNKVLIVSADHTRFMGTMGLKGKGEFYKVTKDGIVYHLLKGGWIDLDYLPHLDRLYVLSGKTAQVIDYRNNTVSEINTGNNLISNGAGTFYICRLQRLPDTNYEIIICYNNGDVRFIDLTENKLVKKIRCGRRGKRFLQALGGAGKAGAVITTNADKSIHYVLNKATKDITVLDQNFDVNTYILSEEQFLGMCQAEKAGFQSIVATENKLYRITPENSLEPFYELNEKAESCKFYEDEGRLIIWTDREMLVLDAVSLEVKYQVFWHVKKDEIESKLLEDSRRYWFMNSI